MVEDEWEEDKLEDSRELDDGDDVASDELLWLEELKTEKVGVVLLEEVPETAEEGVEVQLVLDETEELRSTGKPGGDDVSRDDDEDVASKVLDEPLLTDKTAGDEVELAGLELEP